MAATRKAKPVYPRTQARINRNVDDRLSSIERTQEAMQKVMRSLKKLLRGMGSD